MRTDRAAEERQRVGVVVQSMENSRETNLKGCAEDEGTLPDRNVAKIFNVVVISLIYLTLLIIRHCPRRPRPTK
jgi:hypothetical protein